MKRIVTLSLGAAAVVLLAGFGWGWRAAHDPEKLQKFINFKIDDTLDDLKATDAQRAQVHQIADGLFREWMGLRKDRRATRQALLAQWRAESPDPRAVYAAIDEQGDRMRTFAHHLADAAMRIHDLLTPEQRQLLARRFSHRRCQY